MNLQLALILLGILVVAGVYFYSRWDAGRRGGEQGNRHHRRTASSFAEPSFGGDADGDADQAGSMQPLDMDSLDKDSADLGTAEYAIEDDIYDTPARPAHGDGETGIDPVFEDPVEDPDQQLSADHAEIDDIVQDAEPQSSADDSGSRSDDEQDQAEPTAGGAPPQDDATDRSAEIEPLPVDQPEPARSEAAPDETVQDGWQDHVLDEIADEGPEDGPAIADESVEADDFPVLDSPIDDEPSTASRPTESLEDHQVESVVEQPLDALVDEREEEEELDEGQVDCDAVGAPNHGEPVEPTLDLPTQSDPVETDNIARETPLEIDSPAEETDTEWHHDEIVDEDSLRPLDASEDDSESPEQLEEEPEHDALLEERPSLKAFIGTMKPLDKLKGSIQQKLDAVKAERDGTAPPKPPKQETVDGVKDKPSDSKRWWQGGFGKRGQADLLGGLDQDGGDEDQVEVAAGRSMREDPVLGIEPDIVDSDPDQLAQPTSLDNDPLDDEPVQPINPEPSAASVTPISSAASQARSSTNETILPAEGFEKLSQIDYYVKLSGDRDVSRESVLAVYREASGALSKTHSIYGLRLPDKVWRDLELEPEESRFGDLVITIQLADQDGPVSEHDMTRFSSLVMKLSETTGRGFAFMAPVESAHEHALAIERFRRRFDSIFVVNIRPLEEEAFEGAVIDRCATQIGLTPDSNGFYARYKPVGKQRVCLYSLANMSDTGEFDMDNLKAVRTRGVTFFTRPAVNRSPGAVFAEMVDAAKAFASRIKGEVIAPGYEDLSSDDVEAIRRSIETVAAEMESYGINPGSEEATRLF